MSAASPNSPADEEREDLAEGTLLSHLVELRTRLVRIAAAVLVVFVAMLPFAKELFSIAAEPLVSVLPGGKMIATKPASPLIAPFMLSFYLALFVAMPVVLHQIWAFIAPGLYRKEKRFAFPLLGTSILLFYAGIAFAYFVVFPLMFKFFTGIAPVDVEVQPDITEFLSFTLTIVLAFGLAFEVPIATVLLCWTGFMTTEKLGKARPYVFLGAFVLGMFLTPPDVISQTLLAVPVYLLFELGILMSRFLVAREKEPPETDGD